MLNLADYVVSLIYSEVISLIFTILTQSNVLARGELVLHLLLTFAHSSVDSDLDSYCLSLKELFETVHLYKKTQQMTTKA